MARRRSKKQRFAVTVLTFCAVYLVLFSVAQMVSFAFTQTEQTELISMTFTVFGVEAGALMLKRIVEVIFKKKEEE